MEFVEKVFERVPRGGVFERVVAIPHGEGGEILALSRQIDNFRGQADEEISLMPSFRGGVLARHMPTTATWLEMGYPVEFLTSPAGDEVRIESRIWRLSR